MSEESLTPNVPRLPNMDAGDEPSKLEVRTYFVRERNALLARAHFEPLYVDYYLHQGQLGLQHAPFHDELFKEALAALTLHLACRPWNEMVAWTVHFQLPRINLFLTGDNGKSTVVGQIFTEDVKDIGANRILADVIRQGQEPRRSVVDFESKRPFGGVESFYKQSEQRLARFFTHDEEDFVFVVAQPDCDLPWLESLTDETVRSLDKSETLSLLEKRVYHWECGCTEAKMMQVLTPVMKSDPEGLFGTSDLIRMRCPRCGWRYTITKEALEGYVSGQ